MLEQAKEFINRDGHFLILIGIVLFGYMIAAATPAFAISPETIWYKGDGDATDSGLYGLHLTSGAGAAFGAGKIGQAFKFNGARSSNVNHTSDAHYDLSSEFSISFWVYDTSTTGYQIPISRFATGGWQVEGQPTNGRLYWYTTGYVHNSGTQNAFNSAWRLIIWQREADGKLHLYVDNAEDGAGVTDVTTYNAANPFMIGDHGTSASTYPMAANSLIDDVRIWTATSLNSTYRDMLWNSGAGTNQSLNYSAPSAIPFNITMYAPNGTYHNMSVNISGMVVGNSSNYSCWYSVNGTNSSNFSLANNTNFSTAMPSLLNGTHTAYLNCTDGYASYNVTRSFNVSIGLIDLITWNEATSNHTQANLTTILVYNSSSSVNFTGNNFSWGYTSLPGGNISIIAFFNNITRETSLINNATNYANVTLSFPSMTGTYYFLIQNSYNNPIEGALVTFSKLDGTLITQRYSGSDGFVNDIFLTQSIPVSVSLSKSGYITKAITFTPYITTQLPVKITMLTFSNNGTEYNPFKNVSYSCSPQQFIVDNNTLITCTIMESNSQMLSNTMRVYYVNYSGSYLSKTTTCNDPSICTFTFTTNKTTAKFRFNLTMNLSYGNYSSIREYVTNGTADVDLPTSTDLGVGVWKFIFFVILLVVLAITWGYIGPLALLIVPLIIGIGVHYHVFGIGELIILLIVVFILFMKMV